MSAALISSGSMFNSPDINPPVCTLSGTTDLVNIIFALATYSDIETAMSIISLSAPVITANLPCFISVAISKGVEFKLPDNLFKLSILWSITCAIVSLYLSNKLISFASKPALASLFIVLIVISSSKFIKSTNIFPICFSVLTTPMSFIFGKKSSPMTSDRAKCVISPGDDNNSLNNVMSKSLGLYPTNLIKSSIDFINFFKSSWV